PRPNRPRRERVLPEPAQMRGVPAPPSPAARRADRVVVRHECPMSDLFASAEASNLSRVAPLAARMRPRTLAEFAGQQHLVGEGQLLWRLLQARKLGSVIFYGPPGTGKTTLAKLLASHLS